MSDPTELMVRHAHHERISVLMVTGAYYPEISSGGLQCQQVARMIGDRALVEVLTTSVDRSLPLRDEIDGVRVRRVPVDVGSAASRLKASGIMLVRLLRSMPRVDLVHLHGFSTKNVFVTAVAKLFRRPVVLSLHTAGHDEPQTVARRGRLAWWAYSSADLYLSVSPALVEACVSSALPAGRVRLVANGIDLDRFTPASAADRAVLRSRLGLPGDRRIILFVGFFSREKQPHVLFEAWLRLQGSDAPRPALVCVGARRSAYFEVDDALARDMRERAQRAGVGDQLIFVDPTHRIHDYYRAADVFALPSTREGLPVALLEAMACGLPCVASRLPGATDAIISDGDNGMLVPPGDAEAFASALRTVLTDPVRAARLGERARVTVVSRFADSRTADEWLDAYASVIQWSAA